MQQKANIAILDDYQEVSQKFADWALIKDRANITVFSNYIAQDENLVERLKAFTIICVMRERTPFTKELLSALPNLKLIVSTGSRNASIDVAAANELGIEVKHTGYLWTGAPELTWALLMAISRKIPEESNNFSSGKWQTTVGTDLAGKTLGIIGLGNIGSKIASYANAFGMKVIAWSDNLTPEAALAGGTTYADKETLFKEADFVSVHLVLSNRSKDTITSKVLNLMKPSAYLINTSRGPLVNEADLIAALQQKRIAGAALDVYDAEPLPENHPFRSLKNVLGTPHIGYVTENTYNLFYEDTVAIIKDWLL